MIPLHLARPAIAALFLAVTSLATAAPAPGSPPAREDTVSLNFSNANIDDVIQAIGKISGRNFLIDPRVKGKLDIVTHTPVARDLTYQILLSALRLQGYAAVEGDGLTKIVPEADAKLHGGPVSRNTQVSGDRLATRVFALQYESATQMLPVVRPLIAPNNSVTAFAANNTLVVTDYAQNIERIARIIESIDVPQGDVIALHLQHATAADLAATLTQVLATPGANDAHLRTQVVADSASNSLLVRADNPARIRAVRQLVATLDRPGASGDIHVVYLKNADATRVARTLNATLSRSSASNGGGSGSATSTASQRPTPNTGMDDGSDGNATSLMSGLSGSSSPSTTVTSAGSGLIQADTDNNALIINAPEAIYRNIRQVIDQLDRRRAQVYIEALIAEISTERAAEFGIQWAGGGASGKASVLGATSFGSGGNNLLQLIGGSASGSVALPGNGLTLAIGGGTVNIPGIGEIMSLGLLARFLENEVRANILSTPNIVTLDNEEARIVVGRNVPFVTGSYTTSTSNSVSNPFQTIERKDVGLTLKVRPQISEGGAIRLAIYQEASAVLDSTDTGNGPTTTKRAIESMVMVDDGAIIALGGLVEDSYSGGQEKVPLLGDIPYAGALFRYDNRKRSKTNLVVFLRPVILRDRDDYAAITRSRYDYVIGQQRNSARPQDLLRNEASPAELPAAEAPAPAVPTYAPVHEAELRPLAAP